jgi:dipeptidyl aminopeptidase/acylaminoacyl peptidase
MSRYGVADLEALAKDTHKFEARYLDKLVGPYPERKDLYQERSPIHHASELSCPILILQGSDDPIVPPSQSQALVRALAEKDIPHAYIEFEGEGHGFRKQENIVKALQAELSFYRQVLHINSEEQLEQVPLNG